MIRCEYNNCKVTFEGEDWLEQKAKHLENEHNLVVTRSKHDGKTYSIKISRPGYLD